MRSVPGAEPGRSTHGHECDGVDWPENGVKCAGQPYPRLSIAPVRTSSWASGPFSIRSDCFSQPAGSPGGGVAGVGSGLAEAGAPLDGASLGAASLGDSAGAAVSFDGAVAKGDTLPLGTADDSVVGSGEAERAGELAGDAWPAV